MKKVFITLFVLFTTLSMVFAQGTAEHTNTTHDLRLAWWGNPTRDERTIKVAEMFMKDHPEVKIQTETTGWGSYWDKMNTQAAAGSLPDLMQHAYTYVLEWIKRGQLLPLDSYVKSGALDVSDIDKSFLDSGVVNGKLYAVNLGSNALCLAYDPAVLGKAGITAPDDTTWTWDDFEKMAIQIYKKTGVKTMPLFASEPEVGLQFFVRENGQSIYAKQGSGLGFSDPKIIEDFFGVQLRLLEAGALVNPEVAFVNVTQGESEFAKGNSWVEFMWSNQFVAFQKAANRPLKIALIPSIKDSKQKGTFFMASMYFSIPASAKNPDDAVAFLNYFLNDVSANDVLNGERGVPVPAKIRAHLSENADPVNKQIFDYISHVAGNCSPIDPPDPPKASEFLKLVKDKTMEVLMKKTAPENAANEIIAKGNVILK